MSWTFILPTLIKRIPVCDVCFTHKYFTCCLQVWSIYSFLLLSFYKMLLHWHMHTLNIKQEYLLQFLSLNIDSDVYWEFFVTSPCTSSVPKQTPDITYREKNGNVAVALNCHFTLTWPNLLYPHTFFNWPAIWIFLGKRPMSHWDRWYSECH